MFLGQTLLWQRGNGLSKNTLLDDRFPTRRLLRSFGALLSIQRVHYWLHPISNVKTQNQVPWKRMLADFYSALPLAELPTVSAQDPSNEFPNQSHLQKRINPHSKSQSRTKDTKRPLNFVEAHYKSLHSHYKITTRSLSFCSGSLQNHYKIKKTLQN